MRHCLLLVVAVAGCGNYCGKYMCGGALVFDDTCDCTVTPRGSAAFEGSEGDLDLPAWDVASVLSSTRKSQGSVVMNFRTMAWEIPPAIAIFFIPQIHLVHCFRRDAQARARAEREPRCRDE